jgi:hypothetical protein
MKTLIVAVICCVSLVLFINRPYTENREDFTAEVQLITKSASVTIITKYVIDGVESTQSKNVLGSLHYAEKLTYTNLDDNLSFVGDISPLTKSTDEEGRTVLSYTAKGTVVQ